MSHPHDRINYLNNVPTIKQLNEPKLLESSLTDRNRVFPAPIGAVAVVVPPFPLGEVGDRTLLV
jgi:hypothetical protein